MEIEVKVEPHGSSMKYYCILYRPKKRFNFFNWWRTLVSVWDGASLSFDQPVMFSNFDDAVEYAKKLKDNPELIEQHYDRERKRYAEARDRRNKYYNNRNKSIKL